MSAWQEWTTVHLSAAPLVLLSTIAVFLCVSVCNRLVGLRSFSKMSSTDFVTTVAVGSLIASTISAPSPAIVIGLLSLSALFALKYFVALFRSRLKWVSTVLDNQPILLMRGSEVLHHNLKATQMSLGELHAKLRRANVWNYDQVICVVLESTGDVSVLHSSAPNPADIDEAIFADVKHKGQSLMPTTASSPLGSLQDAQS